MGLVVLTTIWIFVGFPERAFAEYRVFRLAVIGGDGSRDVLSTLDQGQYPEYYPIAANETVAYVKSWMCRGRHGEDVDYCPEPAPQERQPATEQPATSAPTQNPEKPAR